MEDFVTGSDYTDHRRYHASQTGDRRAAERGWDFRPDEPNGKTAAIVLISIVMGVGVLGFFGLAILRGVL
jgi:hypothetical protein